MERVSFTSLSDLGDGEKPRYVFLHDDNSDFACHPDVTVAEGTLCVF